MPSGDQIGCAPLVTRFGTGRSRFIVQIPGIAWSRPPGRRATTRRPTGSRGPQQFGSAAVAAHPGELPDSFNWAEHGHHAGRRRRDHIPAEYFRDARSANFHGLTGERSVGQLQRLCSTLLYVDPMSVALVLVFPGRTNTRNPLTYWASRRLRMTFSDRSGALIEIIRVPLSSGVRLTERYER